MVLCGSADDSVDVGCGCVYCADDSVDVWCGCADDSVVWVCILCG